VIGFTRSVAEEIGASGVTINAVCPGYVDTDMTKESVKRIREKTGKSKAEALAAILSHTPQGRLITPEEVADTVVWLCGEGARGVNGQAIVLDGGNLRS
jgi:NAD(P)-dependent dehydrogenase (short-subunit alcohol dehydrogenase family)